VVNSLFTENRELATSNYYFANSYPAKKKLSS
jgi:hypothetical protein